MISSDFPAMIGNLDRNIRENRLGGLSAALTVRFTPIVSRPNS
jgi:hypothetical protein